jgi:hypothetical protein
MAPPFRPRPRSPCLLLPIEMPPPRPVLIEQDETHDLNGLCCFGFSRAGPPVFITKQCGCALFATGVPGCRSFRPATY